VRQDWIGPAFIPTVQGKQVPRPIYSKGKSFLKNALPEPTPNALLVHADEAVLWSSRPSFRRNLVGIV